MDTFAYGGVPSTALSGGEDIDGHQIYVGRAFFKNDWIPAKVIPGRNVAYVAYAGKEHHVDRFQVLCEQRFDWVTASEGRIPEGAVEGGRTCDGEALYIGRVQHEGSHTLGKVRSSDGKAVVEEFVLGASELQVLLYSVRWEGAEFFGVRGADFEAVGRGGTGSEGEGVVVS